MDETSRLRAATYARQSKDHDAGIGRQQEDTDTLCEQRGYEVVARFADNDVSATKLNRKRPEYEHMMAGLRAGEYDVVVLTYQDRIYRQPIELEHIIPEFEKSRGPVTGKPVLIATFYEGDTDLSTDMGQLQARTKVAFARAEVMRKANRQKRANLDNARNGRPTPHGMAGFGYQADKITPDDAEADAIRWACSHVLAGGSISAILRNWTERGIKPRFAGRTYRDEDGNEREYSGRWTHSTVIKILTNPRIAGLATLPNDPEVIGTGTWAPVITPETLYAVREVLKDPKRAAPRGKVSLGGFIFHCRCGAKVQRDYRYRNPKGARDSGYGIYKCLEFTPKAEGRPGPHVTIKADPVDTWVTDRLLDRMSEPDAAEVFARRDTPTDVPKLKAERAEISQGLARMAGDEAMGLLPRSIYLDAAKRVTARLDEIDAAIAEAGKVDAVALLLSADDPREVWPTLDITVQRAILDSVLHITLRPPGAGARNLDMNALVRVAWRGGL